MTAREQGFLLLTGYLGDPERRPLTVAQFRDLTRAVTAMEKPTEQRELTQEDLLRIGCDQAMAQRILNLLSQTAQLQWYLEKGRGNGCAPVTRVTEGYPLQVRKRMGLDAPGALWCKGDESLLRRPAVALVGSRELLEKNREFACAVGRCAARQGYVLISGNARGADQAAQEACLESGGSVICVVADPLQEHTAREHVLYVAVDGYDMPFTAQGALRRNHVIHSLGEKTFVAQCSLGKGGTWDGTVWNLKKSITPVFCFDDQSDAVRELQQTGATVISMAALADIAGLKSDNFNFFDP